MGIFEDGFGVPAWNLFFQDPLRALGLLAHGQVSEFSAGLPGHFFSQIVYKGMGRLGWRSEGLVDVGVVKWRAANVLEGGWGVDPMTAGLFELGGPWEGAWRAGGEGGEGDVS